MGLIPSTETGQDFCSQTDQHTARCFGLNRETNPQVDLSEICTELIRKMSLRVYGGPVGKFLSGPVLWTSAVDQYCGPVLPVQFQFFPLISLQVSPHRFCQTQLQ